MDKKQLKEYAINAQAMIDGGAVEDKLRHYLSNQLSVIFPECPWWVQAHVQGTEEHVQFGSSYGTRHGFVDSVVGKTAIEYEKNLTVQSIFNEGYYQVKEYCAALYNIGIPEDEILGVLSDTVRWYGYKIHIIGDVPNGQLYGANNIELEQISFIDLSIGTENEYIRFECFINQFMARSASRLLNANTLVTDFGMESAYYLKYIDVFSSMINHAMVDKPKYAELIKQIWQDFIAYLGVSEYGKFSLTTFINEYYLVTVAKIICANILARQAIISDKDELKTILNGNYFTRHNIYNFIEYDYFGWLNDSPYVDEILPCAGEIQKRLQAYDFSQLGERDIFGKLLAQLADREHRLMLGQEFTPHWIAKDIVIYNLKKLGEEEPHILDMCCGSGVFLIEAIKAVRDKYNVTPNTYDNEKDRIAFSCVMGFDIDPLAVILSKVNWIMAMRDLFSVHTGSIIIPIYHADSLFVATPITHHMPTGKDDYYILNIFEHELHLPVFLFATKHRKMFDSIISKVYHLAMTRAAIPKDDIDEADISTLINSAIIESGACLSSEETITLSDTVGHMVDVLENLQREGRNGIWHFIISNSYRPGLTDQQFNCIVSNPPWMAMSKLANNPYKQALYNIATEFNIQPRGAAHPHMELGTIFLVSSIRRYLKRHAYWSCLMPISLLSGLNHEAFRMGYYNNAKIDLNTKVSAIWELPNDTFKNKAIVLSGEKDESIGESTIEGRVYISPEEYTTCKYTLNHQGNRSAWTNRGNDADIVDIISDGGIPFNEGCDIFPRTALFHQLNKRSDGNYDIIPIERTGELWYLINDSKKPLCNDLAAEGFDRKYIYYTFISKQLSPFIMNEPAKTIIPGMKESDGWHPILPSDLALMNSSTSYIFEKISEAVEQDLESYLVDTINIRNKLYHQNFESNNWLVLSNAGGANPCAAYICLNDYNRSRLVVDQTLYWYNASSEEEALYITGLLNSPALANAIVDFQPEGGFGKRHIHTLPYKLIPALNPQDEKHLEVINTTKSLIKEWRTECESGEYSKLLNPNSSTLNSRRRRQQTKIKTLLSYEAYNLACSEVIEG